MEVLTKGKSITLKNAQGAELQNARVDLNWETKNDAPVNVRFSILCLTNGRHDSGGKALGLNDALLYHNRRELPGLNLVGESATIDFNELPVNCTSLLTIINIKDGAKFSEVKEITSGIYDGTHQTPMAKYSTTEGFSDSNCILLGEFYKEQGNWQYRVIDERSSNTDGNIANIIARFE